MRFHIGSSMIPQLRPGDELCVAAYRWRKIRPGDVVTFVSPGSTQPDSMQVVAHRVCRVVSNRIRTRGDNSERADSWVITPEDVIGRVTYLRRGGKWRRVPGGRLGLVSRALQRWLRRTQGRVRILLQPTYRRLAGITTGWLSINAMTRVVRFQRLHGTELQLFVWHRLIGRRLPGDDQWAITCPLRFVVDDAKLPKP